jgi:hypothetical protein
MEPIIPKRIQNTTLDERESSRSSTIANGSILNLIWTRLRSLNCEALASSNCSVLDAFWYNSSITALWLGQENETVLKILPKINKL